MTATALTHITGNTKTGTLTAQTQTQNGLQLKNVVDPETGGETSIITGYAATTHIDQGQDKFTVEALRSMAQTINENQDTNVSAVFPEIEGMDESQIGNLNHNNNPAAEKLIGAGDTRTVPVFKVTQAEVVTTQDGQFALEIRGEMLPLPDDLEEAIKGQIRQGGLHSFSIEFAATQDDIEFDTIEGEPVRRILDAQAQGVALTGRPMNKEAIMTNAELKTILAAEAENDNLDDNISSENQSMTKKEEQDSKEQEEEVKSMDLEAKAADIAAGTDMDEEVVLQVLRAMYTDEEEEMKSEEAEESEEDDEEKEEEEEESEPEEEVKSEEAGEDEEESEEEPEEDEDEELDLKSELSEIKNKVKELKSEKEELQAEMEDMKTLEGVKSEITQIKSQIEDSDVDLEGDRPLVDTDEERGIKSEDNRPQWQRSIDQQGLTESDLKSKAGASGKSEAQVIADIHGVKVEEVLDYAK